MRKINRNLQVFGVLIAEMLTETAEALYIGKICTHASEYSRIGEVVEVNTVNISHG